MPLSNYTWATARHPEQALRYGKWCVHPGHRGARGKGPAGPKSALRCEWRNGHALMASLLLWRPLPHPLPGSRLSGGMAPTDIAFACKKHTRIHVGTHASTCAISSTPAPGPAATCTRFLACTKQGFEYYFLYDTYSKGCCLLLPPLKPSDIHNTIVGLLSHVSSCLAPVRIAGRPDVALASFS